MTVIAGWMIRRFLRLQLWTAALALPLALFLWAFFLADRPAEFAYSVLLGLITYLLPVLTSVYVLTSVDRSRWDLILTRRIGFPGLLVGTWLGGATPFVVCSLALIAVAEALGAGTSISPQSGGLVFCDDVRVESTAPAGLEGRERLEHPAPWRFEVRGLPAPADAKTPSHEATLRARVGRYRETEAGPVLVQASRVEATVWFPSLDEADPDRLRTIELRDDIAVPLSIPARAVGEDGRLVVLVAPRRHEPVERGEDGHGAGALQNHPENDSEEDPEDGAAGDATGAHHTHGHDQGVGPGGPPVFWFQRDVDSNGNPTTGLLIVEGRISFVANFLRASLQATGLILLLAGITTFAAALFSWPVAFACSLTLFICGSGMSFLREVSESLSYHAPGLVLRWVQELLEFWIAVLPDFGRLKGAEYLLGGEAIRWSTVLSAHGVALAYCAVFLVLAVVALWRWEVDR